MSKLLLSSQQLFTSCSSIPYKCWFSCVRPNGKGPKDGIKSTNLIFTAQHNCSSRSSSAVQSSFIYCSSDSRQPNIVWLPTWSGHEYDSVHNASNNDSVSCFEHEIRCPRLTLRRVSQWLFNIVAIHKGSVSGQIINEKHSCMCATDKSRLQKVRSHSQAWRWKLLCSAWLIHASTSPGHAFF